MFSAEQNGAGPLKMQTISNTSKAAEQNRE